MTEKNPLTSQRYKQLKKDLLSLAEEFEWIGSEHGKKMSQKIFKLTDQLDAINGENVDYQALVHRS